VLLRVRVRLRRRRLGHALRWRRRREVRLCLESSYGERRGEQDEEEEHGELVGEAAARHVPACCHRAGVGHRGGLSVGEQAGRRGGGKACGGGRRGL